MMTYKCSEHYQRYCISILESKVLSTWEAMQRNCCLIAALTATLPSGSRSEGSPRGRYFLSRLVFFTAPRVVTSAMMLDTARQNTLWYIAHRIRLHSHRRPTVRSPPWNRSDTILCIFHILISYLRLPSWIVYHQSTIYLKLIILILSSHSLEYWVIHLVISFIFYATFNDVFVTRKAMTVQRRPLTSTANTCNHWRV